MGVVQNDFFGRFIPLRSVWSNYFRFLVFNITLLTQTTLLSDRCRQGPRNKESGLESDRAGARLRTQYSFETSKRS
jgi:hypothetical protein